MWQADPFKAKWTILAKAYSTIRDVQGKANAPLNQFLALNAPVVRIIEPPKYLNALGWVLFVENDGHTVIRREQPRIDIASMATGISVNGIIANSYLHGYFTGRLSDVLLTNDEATVTMSNGIADNPTQPIANPIAHPRNDESLNNSVASAAGHTNASIGGAQNIPDQDSGAQRQESDGPDKTSSAAMPAMLSEAHSNEMIEDPSMTNSTAGHTMSPSLQTEALFPVDFRLPLNDFALDEAFDPMLYNEQPVFDPFAGNQFDAFDWMDGWDEYINADACA